MNKGINYDDYLGRYIRNIEESNRYLLNRLDREIELQERIDKAIEELNSYTTFAYSYDFTILKTKLLEILKGDSKEEK